MHNLISIEKCLLFKNPFEVSHKGCTIIKIMMRHSILERNQLVNYSKNRFDPSSVFP